jgi:hypothetical protein
VTEIGDPFFSVEQIGDPFFSVEQIGDPFFSVEQIGDPFFSVEQTGTLFRYHQLLFWGKNDARSAWPVVLGQNMDISGRLDGTGCSARHTDCIHSIKT